MQRNILQSDWENLDNSLKGELKIDSLSKMIYATDASVYREIPLAVVYPKNNEDLKKLIDFAHQYNIGLTPRTAATSLAGQCATNGIVVDVYKYFTSIINLDIENSRVTVQPGVISCLLYTSPSPRDA